MRRTGIVVTLLAVLAALLGPSSSAVDAAEQRPAAVPSLAVSNAVAGLEMPWDVKQLPGGRLLIGERSTKRLLIATGGTKKVLKFASDRVWASGETGLMGLAVDPDFATNRRIYTCQGWLKAGGGHDVRVIAWKINSAYSAVSYVGPLVSGFPTSSGRHGGCRLLITRAGSLMVGTGDAAVGTNPQNLTVLGGKTLRLNRFTGAPWPTNRWIKATSKNQRYIYTYGHRNVQGLTQRADGTLFSVEQGTDRDDEVNKLHPGANYGWNPVPGYDESKPMTDQSLPGPQYSAKWSSGNPTLATSGAAWVRGSQWGSFDGTLAVAALKSTRVIFMKFDSHGHLLWTRSPAALQTSGRLRSVTQAASGDLLITTSNGTDDVVLRVHPNLG
ncbi:MAG: PQQ-dependent sugar dehydrogenase [Marmoricola sp.]|nr:PQQ-dependent sugar dehydrogenase [Marmoricola sp.]